MDINAITQIIASLGFPIAACVAMFWQNTKLEKQHQEEMSSINKVIGDMQIALANNTNAINNLVNLIGKEGETESFLRNA